MSFYLHGFLCVWAREEIKMHENHAKYVRLGSSAMFQCLLTRPSWLIAMACTSAAAFQSDNKLKHNIVLGLEVDLFTAISVRGPIYSDRDLAKRSIYDIIIQPTTSKEWHHKYTICQQKSACLVPCCSIISVWFAMSSGLYRRSNSCFSK